MEAVGGDFEGMDPLFDEASVDVVKTISQPETREGSRVAAAIDEKHGIIDIMFLSVSMEKHCSRTSALATERGDIQRQIRLSAGSSVYLLSLAINLDSELVNRDSYRHCRRRVGNVPASRSF